MAWWSPSARIVTAEKIAELANEQIRAAQTSEECAIAVETYIAAQDLIKLAEKDAEDASQSEVDTGGWW
jgi:hypothetical protein